MIEPFSTLPAAAAMNHPLRGGHLPAPLEQPSEQEQPLRMAVRSTSPAQQAEDKELRETFDQFVGETFYGTLLKAMRKGQGKPAYLHGGRGEEVFQGQLDQLIVEDMASSSGSDLSGAMFELFQLNRR